MSIHYAPWQLQVYQSVDISTDTFILHPLIRRTIKSANSHFRIDIMLHAEYFTAGLRTFHIWQKFVDDDFYGAAVKLQI